MRLWAVILLVLLTLTSAVVGCGAAGSNDGGSSGASETESAETEAAETENTDTEATATEEAETEKASEFDVAALEASLKESLSPSSSGGLSGSGDQPKVQEVDCPDDVEGKTGGKFTCAASGESGLAGSVDVELMNDEGTAYRYKGKLEADGFTTESSGTVTDG